MSFAANQITGGATAVRIQKPLMTNEFPFTLWFYSNADASNEYQKHMF